MKEFMSNNLILTIVGTKNIFIDGKKDLKKIIIESDIDIFYEGLGDGSLVLSDAIDIKTVPIDMENFDELKLKRLINDIGIIKNREYIRITVPENLPNCTLNFLNAKNVVCKGTSINNLRINTINSKILLDIRDYRENYNVTIKDKIRKTKVKIKEYKNQDSAQKNLDVWIAGSEIDINFKEDYN